MTPPESFPPPAGVDGEPLFAEPWQAKAFALTMHLHERGAFSWAEWTAALGRRCTGALPYFEAWTRALEDLLADRGLADPASVDRVAEAWHRAAEATPHGEPIRLGNDRA